MNPRYLVVPVLAAAIAAAVWFFLGTESYVSVGTLPVPTEPGGGAQAETAKEQNPARENSGDSQKPGVKTGKMDWEILTALEAGNSRPAPSEEDIARFLAKHGETPANLVAAFEIAKDHRLLDRALELFPNSPLVLMKAIDAAGSKPPPKEGEAYQMSAEKLALIERFKDADPNNPVPWIFAAQEFFKAKQTADALADIRAALERPAFYIYANERMDAAQRLYESIGIGKVEASTLAMFGLTLPHMQAALQTSRGLMEWQKSAAESGDTAASEEALKLTYSLGRTFATPEASRLLIGQLVGISMEKRAIEAVPAGSQPDWLKVNPSVRLTEIEQKKADVKGVAAGIESVIRSQDSELIAEYLRRMRTESEAAAYEWLKTQKK